MMFHKKINVVTIVVLISLILGIIIMFLQRWNELKCFPQIKESHYSDVWPKWLKLLSINLYHKNKLLT